MDVDLGVSKGNRGVKSDTCIFYLAVRILMLFTETRKSREGKKIIF